MTVRTWSKGGAGTDLLVRGARVVDPLAGLDRRSTSWSGRARSRDRRRPRGAARVRVVDGAGRLLLPGFVDLHAHLRTPGREDEEDLDTGLGGGRRGRLRRRFRDGQHRPGGRLGGRARGIAQRAATEASVPIGFFASMSRDLAGKQLTEMHELAQAGAVGFSDDGKPLATAQLLRRALQYVKVTDRFVALHAQDDALMGAGVMHEGPSRRSWAWPASRPSPRAPTWPAPSRWPATRRAACISAT